MRINPLPLLILGISWQIAVAAPPKFTSETILQLERLELQAKVQGTGKVPEMQAYIRFTDSAIPQQLSELGVKVDAVGKTVLTARIPLEIIDKLREMDGIDCVQAAQPAKMLMDTARPISGVDKVHAGTGIDYDIPFTGKGVMVSAIDGGLDFKHPAFYTDDRSKLRLEKVWLMDDTKGTPPAGYDYGSEYATQEDILAKGTDMSYSHGSHVMNIAAGANLTSPYHGIAYDATLGFVHFADIDKGISDGISYLFKFADEKKMPGVINMSLGTEMGPHDGSSLRDVLGDELSGPGKILVGASGNNAMVDMHITKTFTDDDTQILAGLAFLEGLSGIGELQIWGEPGKKLKVNVCTISKETMEPVYKSRTYDCSKETTQSVTLQKPFDGSGGYFKIITQTSPLNNKPMAHITTGITDYLPDKVLAVIITGEPGTTVHAWTNENYCCFKKHLSNMDTPDPKYGICEIGGTGKSIITVGSYTTKNSVMCLNGKPAESGFEVGDISPFSNVGPSVDGRLKPDIAAPGSLIVSAFNSALPNDVSIVVNESWNGKNYPYGVYQGTSMASPHVAGIVALWLQACPTLTPDQIRDVLLNTSVRDKATGSEPNNTWGRGKIDAYNGLKYVLKTYSQAGVVDEAVGDKAWSANILDQNLEILYYKAVETLSVNIFDATGKMVKTSSYGRRAMGDCDSIDLSDLRNGFYIISVNGSSIAKNIKFVKK